VDNAELTALVRQAQQLGTQAQAQARAGRSSLLPDDEKDVALANYRTIAGVCGRAIEQLRPQDGQASPETVVAVQALLQIARLCTSEHDRICQADEARRERTRRWSEVHEEFDASQREGRLMRSDWSWERHARWEGDIT
jgi:hypothetical protein